MLSKTYIRWILAILITLAAVVYQRLTGPTHPLRGTVEIEGQKIKYRLLRSHVDESDQLVSIPFIDSTSVAEVFFKRYKTGDDWTRLDMAATDGKLTAALPKQPPAGKLEYYIHIQKGRTEYLIPPDRTVITRFKGAVPNWALFPHVLLMFIAMLLSVLSALEALAKGPRILRYTLLTTICLFIGGMILGPVVQKFAFGEFWTGIPFGHDLTDNKTLVAMIGWLAASWQVLRKNGAGARWWVVAAGIILLLVYSIPHSTLGSELDYETMKVIQGN